MKIKTLILCSIITLAGCQTNATDKPIRPENAVQTAEQKELNAKSAKLDEAMAESDRHYREYIAAKRDVWAYEQLNKYCNNIQNSEYEQMFIRYMRKKHPVEAEKVIFNASPTSIRITKMFADIFMRQEVIPRKKDFYLANERCPSLSDLNFPY